ncbi:MULTISPECIES: hypothetical protein [unclassified Schlesneria]|uniref:hypothetical protein n=1 Tax=unclassified Schlesneria TaxID=2762017 RepID=UPI002EF5D08C
MKLAHRSVLLAVTVASSLILMLCTHGPTVRAQQGKGKPKILKSTSSVEVKQIDARLQKLQDNFEAESKAIIDGYERSGQFDRAKFLLEVLLKLDPSNEDFKKRVTELEDQLLKTTEFDIKFDAASDWTPVGTVQKDKLTRVEASGDYKLIMTAATVTADGFPSDNVMQDLISRVPTGALMGMVVTDENQSGKQPPEPFPIKSKLEFTPKKEGVLYLKVNSPPGAKCVGDLKVKVSGVTRAS